MAKMNLETNISVVRKESTVNGEKNCKRAINKMERETRVRTTRQAKQSVKCSREHMFAYLWKVQLLILGPTL